MVDRGTINAVDNVSFELDRQEQIALVGESGAGKSVTGLSIMGLVENPGTIDDGSTVIWKGEDLLSKSDSEMDAIRGREIAWIPQNPLSALNPTATIGKQIKETMRVHNFAPEDDLDARAIELLEEVGISDAETRLSDYPHAYSGGMRQRVLIAIALSCNPDLIIADEPTTALDVLIQAQLIKLLKQTTKQHETALLLITHDLGLVAEICERAMVMYAGEIVEKAEITDLFDEPLHPYTRELMRCSPSITDTDRLNSIPGSAPDSVAYPSGCRFHPRCPKAFEECSVTNPDRRQQSDEREVACLLYE